MKGEKGGKEEDSRREEGERDLEWQVTIKSVVRVTLGLKGGKQFEQQEERHR